MRAVLRTILVAVPIVAIAMFAAAPSASAHASFVSSDPADGASVPTSPSAVTIVFTEPADPAISKIEVVDGAGQPVEVGPLAVSPRNELRAPLTDELADGSYTVSWFVISTVDGHRTAGAFAFGVGDAEVVRADTEVSAPGPDVAGVAGRVLLYLGLSLLVALAAVAGWAFRGRLRATRTVAIVAALAAVAGVALFVTSEVAIADASVTAFLRSETGGAVVVLLVAVAAAAGAAVAVAARPTPVTLTLAGVAAVAAWAARAAAGHPDGLAQTLGQTVHMSAVGVWIGGLVLLALLLRERRGDPTPIGEVRRFSALALVAVIAVIATGSVRAVQELGGFGALGDAIGTGYGQVLGVKVALALGLVALGAVNRRRSIPKAEAGAPGLLGRVVRAEVVVAAGIAVLTGALTSLPPGGLEAPASAPTSIADEASDFGTTIRVELSATPGTAGPNTFDARVTDFDSGETAQADGVTLRFSRVGAGAGPPPGSLDLASAGDRWRAEGSALSIAGTWNVTALVRTGAQTVDVPLVLTTRVPGATTTVAEVPGQPSLTTIAYPDGTSAQLYADPGAAGANQIHLTVFDADGGELPLDDATLALVPPSGPADPADVLRFGPGHFVANVELDDGPWTFGFTAVPAAGTPLQATLSTTIGAAS